VVIEVVRIGQSICIQQPAAAVERDLRLATVSDPGPRFGLLRGQLHGDTMLRRYLGPGPRGGDDTVIIPAGPPWGPARRLAAALCCCTKIKMFGREVAGGL
jgi:hypothetical protein